MCGIAGYVDWDGAPDEQSLRAAERCLHHRGPDGGGVWREGPVGLVHRRLRVIDLSPAAAQPMSNEDGTVQVVFNGEIYNFQSLRDELLTRGHRFKSQSDTEVLVHGYETWGTELFSRLRGMFALAIWVGRSRQLILARDRFGKKPLYYHAGPRRLIFGSELAVFRSFPDLTLRLRPDSFRQFIEYGYVPGANSILEGVHRLEPGHFAMWSEAGFQRTRYWSLPERPPSHRPADDVAAAAIDLEAPFREAVSRRLVSDVPLGCFLSGGLDSSLVTAVAQECLGSRLKTYTVGFESSPMNEAAHAARIAKHLGTEHTELTVKPEVILDEFEAILALAAEPQGDDSFLPTYLISRATRAHVTVALSGDGGDELFAGYRKYRQFASARRWQRLPAPWGVLEKLAPRDDAKKKLAALATPGPLELARWLSSLWKRADLPALLAPALGHTAGRDFFEQRWLARPEFSEIERWMLADMETYMEAGILTKVDRASMAVSLEVRSPFLDQDFVEAALRWECRAQPRTGGKRILKAMLARRVPPDLFERPKQGFGMPIDDWYRGPLRKTLEHFTDPRRLSQRGLLQPATVQAAVEAHVSGRRNFGRRLHAIVAFEIWADQFFGGNTALA